MPFFRLCLEIKNKFEFFLLLRKEKVWRLARREGER